jgi:hypothetical protein
MARLEILEFPDSRLRTVAKPVARFDQTLMQLVADMTETMYAENGIGLAATQVNVHRQVLVLDVSESRDCLRVYVNPEILQQDGSPGQSAPRRWQRLRGRPGGFARHLPAARDGSPPGQAVGRLSFAAEAPNGAKKAGEAETLRAEASRRPVSRAT